MKAKIDKILNSWISKKLLVFLVACVFVGLGKITDQEFTNIAMIYIGGQTVVDSISKLRGKQID